MSRLCREAEAARKQWGSSSERAGSSWTTGKTRHFPSGTPAAPHKYWDTLCGQEHVVSATKRPSPFRITQSSFTRLEVEKKAV